ncbi:MULTISPECIES: YciI family protein [Microbacterium]|uniref:YciI family protein n=1 Tax=Microbacterium TaxID=33882 RepID=UPI000D6519CE|nr:MULTISPECIES: YciI family protein [Microbacterium]
MAQYLILIYGDEARWDAVTDDERQRVDEGHRAFRERAAASIRASGELEPTRMATTLRSGGEQPLITDGPFLETKEVLGGFYVVDVPDLDAALDLAGLLAEVRQGHGGVQVHPLVDHS